MNTNAMPVMYRYSFSLKTVNGHPALVQVPLDQGEFTYVNIGKRLEEGEHCALIIYNPNCDGLVRFVGDENALNAVTDAYTLIDFDDYIVTTLIINAP